MYTDRWIIMTTLNFVLSAELEKALTILGIPINTPEVLKNDIPADEQEGIIDRFTSLLKNAEVGYIKRAKVVLVEKKTIAEIEGK